MTGGMCPWGKCPGGTCPGGFCPVTSRQRPLVNLLPKKCGNNCGDRGIQCTSDIVDTDIVDSRV